MNRRLVAAVWVTGATTTLLLATVFVVGCCVLPFHDVMHKLMPICEMAASVMRGGHDADAHDHDALPPSPSRDKQEPVKRLVSEIPGVFQPLAHGAPRIMAANPMSSYRSFITLGAVRCDQDVGLHVLVETFLI